MINQAIVDIVSRNYVYSVVGECNGCGLCEFLAVDNFARTTGERMFQVVKQPVTWEEKEQCQEAMERCPLQGITRHDGALPKCEI